MPAMAHTFDVERADLLEDVGRYRFCSREELVALVGSDVDHLVDLGSGTGFYTRDLAPHVEECVGLDVQRPMHELHRDHGLAANVSLLTGDVDALPFADDSLDVVVTTMTFHEICTPEGLEEVARVLQAGGRLVSVDWSADGEGEAGPPREERESADSATALLERAGLVVERAEERPETFVVVARPA